MKNYSQRNLVILKCEYQVMLNPVKPILFSGSGDRGLYDIKDDKLTNFSC